MVPIAVALLYPTYFLHTKNSLEPVQETSSHLPSDQRCCMQFCTAAPAGWPPPPVHQLVQVLGRSGAGYNHLDKYIDHLENAVPSLQVQVPSVAASLPPSQPLLLLESAVSTPSTTR